MRVLSSNSKTPHIIAEELINILISKFATIILGNEARMKRELVLLSSDGIRSQIAGLSLDILEQIILHMKGSRLKISLQLNKAIDVSNGSQLIALVRYVHDSTIKKNFLFCEKLKAAIKAKGVLEFVKTSIQNTNPIFKVLALCALMALLLC